MPTGYCIDYQFVYSDLHQIRTDGDRQMTYPTTNQLIAEFAKVLDIPSDADRTAMWEAELVRRFNAGAHLSKEDLREAKKLLGIMSPSKR